MGKPAPIGNKYGTKLKQPDHRQEAYKQYCAHIAAGYSKKSWHYRHATDHSKSLCWATMERYMEESPTEFDSLLMRDAESQSLRYFEDEGRKLMQGRYRNGSPEVWKTFMRNKFSWDKEMMEQVVKCSADKILEEIRSRNPEKQKHYNKVKSK